jgi:hypothetical protein
LHSRSKRYQSPAHGYELALTSVAGEAHDGLDCHRGDVVARLDLERNADARAHCICDALFVGLAIVASADNSPPVNIRFSSLGGRGSFDHRVRDLRKGTTEATGCCTVSRQLALYSIKLSGRHAAARTCYVFLELLPSDWNPGRNRNLSCLSTLRPINVEVHHNLICGHATDQENYDVTIAAHWPSILQPRHLGTSVIGP